MRIQQIYLFTNRNSIFFDETGQQIPDAQDAVSWKPIESYRDYKVHTVLHQVVKDQPKIYIARWQQWANEITIDEFCSLIGYGPWYWDTYRKIEYTRALDTKTSTEELPETTEELPETPKPEIPE